MTEPARRPDLPVAQVDRAAARSRSTGPWSVEQLRPCWIVLTGVGVLLSVAAGVVGGGRGLAGAVVGIGIVGAFFTLSTLVIAAVGARHPKAVLLAALVTYLIKIVALGAVVVLLPPDGPVSTRWLAIAVLAGLVSWIAAHLRYVWTAKLFYVDPR